MAKANATHFSERLAEQITAQPDYAGLQIAFLRLDQRLARAAESAENAYGSKATSDPFRGLHLSPEDVDRMLTRQPGAPLLWAGEETQTILPEFSQKDQSRLSWLARTFSLSSFDLDALIIALAPEIDLRYENLYAYLQDDITRRRPSIDLVLNLLCPSAEAKIRQRTHFTSDAPLLRHNLIRLIPDPHQLDPPMLAYHVKLDEQILRFLIHLDGLDHRLVSFARIIEPEVSLDDLPLNAEIKYFIQSIAPRTRSEGQPLRLYFYGPRGTGKLLAAEVLASQLGMQLLVVDLSRALAVGEKFEQTIKLIFREARFGDAILYLSSLDVLRANDSDALCQSLLDLLTVDTGITILGGTQQWVPGSSLHHGSPMGVISVPFSTPDYIQRRKYWQTGLSAIGIAIEQSDLDTLAERFSLTGAQISEAVAIAGNRVHWPSVPPSDGNTPSQVSFPELFVAAREQLGFDLATLARKIEPRYTWTDIVLPPDPLSQLIEICNQAKFHTMVYENWGFGHRMSLGKDLTVLFSGSSGTGKTMAAEIIANELKLDLYKIDLSRVVSKYIGETEKNLDRIFTTAEDTNAILFFDEADALFGKRSQVRDSHDRYANIEIGYLLQKMEEYEGITILATNMRNNMDEAFIRRLKFHVEFPFPEESDRYQIWKLHFPVEAPRADDVDFEFLSRQFKLAGGNIRNIVLNASFLAAADGQTIRMSHLMLATKREYQKMGKTRSEAEFGAYYPLIRD